MTKKLVDGVVMDLTADEEAAWGVPATVVPASVSMRQARLALLNAGLLSTVQTYMDGASEATRIEWEFATDVWRNRDLVAGIGSTLGLTSDQIDALFIAAAAIP